jgi:DNA (cytosine-5)-methyltransferase 1
LDDLFFDFIDVAKKLNPRIVVAENVKGLILGNARGYVKQIFQQFDDAGYDVQLFLLNAAKMGVPQARERTFFVARRKDLKKQNLKLQFDEDIVTFGKSIEDLKNQDCKKLTDNMRQWWDKCSPGEPFSKVHPKKSLFNWYRVGEHVPLPTMAAMSLNCGMICHYAEPRSISLAEAIRGQTFPDDYNFLKAQGKYVLGMSVPPFMMQRVAKEIYSQWLT